MVAANHAMRRIGPKTGIGAHLGWHDMEVSRKESGEPFVILHGKGEALLRERQGRTVRISLSHTQVHATAIAILESFDGPETRAPSA